MAMPNLRFELLMRAAFGHRQRAQRDKVDSAHALDVELLEVQTFGELLLVISHTLLYPKFPESRIANME